MMTTQWRTRRAMALGRVAVRALAGIRTLALGTAIAASLAGCGNESGTNGGGNTGRVPAALGPDASVPDASGPVALPPSNAGADGSAGSDSSAEVIPASAGLVRVTIKGEEFELEPALDSATRYRGLGGRASLPERGGMIFAFPFSERLEFVMRDCLIDIDIAYLNNQGRVLALHTMVVQPREPGEADAAYEARLARYSSRYPARFAVEVRGGLLGQLGLRVGDVIEFEHEALKARAR